jgi:hypothetical protein
MQLQVRCQAGFANQFNGSHHLHRGPAHESNNELAELDKK